MPVTAGEQRGFIVFGIGLLLVMTLVAWLSSNQSDQGAGSPSSYNVQRGGAKAAYLLLKQSGYAVERWSSSARSCQQMRRVCCWCWPGRNPIRRRKR